MSESSFSTDFRALLAKHGITAPRFAHGARAFDAAKPSCLYSGPIYGVNEMVAATTALVEGKWSVAGEYCHRFEQAFSRYLGQRDSVAVNSGSSADLIMVAAAKACYGWQDGDGVIVSPCGFPTTISAITLNGLIPVFVDIEWDTLNADNDAIRAILLKQRADGGNVKAIFVSPVLGNPPEMDLLLAMSVRYGVKILMDGCDSLGSTWRGKHLSSYAAATSCSFFPAHHLATIQGGMISSNDTSLITLARSMGAWGKSCYCSGIGNMAPNGCCGKRFSAWLPDEPDLVLDHRYIFTTDSAYNTQMTEIQGALGCAQMERIEAIHTARRAAYERIAGVIETHLGISRRHVLPHASPSWFGVPILCPDYAYKVALTAHLEANAVQTRSMFAGNILQQPGYRHLGVAADYPKANQVLRRVLFIGCPPFYTEAHFSHIEETIKTFVPPPVQA